jgi:two-component system chemotaxis response regulator CheB
VSGGVFDSGAVIALGASTGGTEALKEVLLRLPAAIPPTVIVQHIPPVFSRAFADRLAQLCPFAVKEAEHGDKLRPGLVLIAPGGRQMKLALCGDGLEIRLTDDPPVNRHRPSVDYLFESVAEHVGAKAVAAILTGMGSDGAAGLLALRKKGARTIAQDEATSVVYGMPKAARQNGGAEMERPLDEIAGTLMRYLQARKTA